MDYHMTEEVKTVTASIRKVKEAITDSSESTKSQQEAINALDNVVSEVLETAIGSQLTRNTTFDKFIQETKKLGYQAALASVPRAGAELGSNIMYAMSKPVEFLAGIKVFGGFSMGSEGLNAMTNLGSSETLRLYDTKNMTGKMVDSNMMKSGTPESKKSRSDIMDKTRFILQFTGLKQVKKVATTIAEKLISTPDKAISRPFWFGSFAKAFKKETGISLTSDDMTEISDGTSKYLGDKYKSARDTATKYADQEVIKMASSKNPFNAIPKNMKDTADSVPLKLYKAANMYMASFMMNEYATARNATLSLFKKGDMSKGQAASTLVGVEMRMAAYMILYSLSMAAFDSLFGFEDETDEEDVEDLIKRQMLGAPISLITGRGLGNIPKIPINFAVEQFNEEYLSSLRSGKDYDPYKHSIVFSQVGQDDLVKKTPEELAVKTFAGPYSPLISTISRSVKVVKGMVNSKKQKTRDKYKKELENRILVEATGNLGFLPFYKDIRRMVLKEQFKDYEKK